VNVILLGELCYVNATNAATNSGSTSSYRETLAKELTCRNNSTISDSYSSDQPGPLSLGGRDGAARLVTLGRLCRGTDMPKQQ
jgi:hypothetical protein